MATQGWVSLSLHEDLAAAVDAYLKENNRGFTSRAEVVATAVRQFLAREHEQNPNVAFEEAQMRDVFNDWLAKAKKELIAELEEDQARKRRRKS